MTTQGFVASHARDAEFQRGLRSFYEYRDLGIKKATHGRVDAHVIRAAAGKEFSSQPHLHRTEFQLVYILKGWIEFEYEGQGVVRLEAGSCVHQPPDIRHRELGHSNDIEMLEVVLPAGFVTEEVSSVDGRRHADSLVSSGRSNELSMHMPQHLDVSGDIAQFRPRGECSLVEAVDRITGAVASCRERRLDRLLVDATGLVGVPIPSLIDRFLMAEDWALAGRGMVAVAMVVRAEYIHPRKFGAKVAADFGLTLDVHTAETDALEWLSSAVDRD